MHPLRSVFDYGFGCQKVHFHCRANFFKIVQQYLEAMRRIVDRYCGARLEKLACKGNSDLLTPEILYKLFESAAGFFAEWHITAKQPDNDKIPSSRYHPIPDASPVSAPDVKTDTP